ncbi:MAG: PH domain-containing protein [Acidimicrobiales bacterium]
MKLPRLRRAQDAYAGSDGPAAAAGTYPAATPTPQLAAERRDGQLVERPPSRLRRIGTSLAETRRRVLPLPDEVIDQYLGHGERMIHNDHPSFRSFVVENTLLFAGLLVVAVLFLGIGFNGSLLGAGILLLILSVVMLVLVLKRLGDRYTSYVVTDTRIMRISGIISRRAHSIPWVRVTDLTIEQSLAGRLFGFATLHIESANEDSGLRDLEGVSDPLQFNQYVVDMVVAKQGATEPIWERRGEPAPVASQRGLRGIRASRRRRGTDRDDDGRTRTEGQPVAATADRRRVSVSGAGSRAGRAPQGSGGEAGEPTEAVESDEDEIERLDAETLARRLRSSGPDLPWRD